MYFDHLYTKDCGPQWQFLSIESQISSLAVDSKTFRQLEFRFSFAHHCGR